MYYNFIIWKILKYPSKSKIDVESSSSLAKGNEQTSF